MKESKEKSKAIAILGMHRSGTSAITRALNFLGVYLGEDEQMVRPRADNPEGFWERGDVVTFHERLLSHCNRPWDTCLSFPDGWHLSEEARPFRDELLELLKKNFSGEKIWAWKDPRTCLTLELWKDVLRELDIELAILFVIRNPIDVARSLEKRNGFSMDKALGIWFNYTLASLKAASGVPLVFISYDRFLEEWESELKKSYAGLGLDWPEDETPIKEKIKTFVRPNLRHSQSGIEELKEAKAPEPVIELYEFIMDTMKGKVKEEELAEKVEELSRDFITYSRFFTYDMMKLWAPMETNRLLAEKDCLLAEKDRQIEGIYQSWSWKVTAPLRALCAIFLSK